MHPLSELIEKHSESGICAPLFKAISGDMSLGFAEAWRRNAVRWSQSMNLTQEEAETVQMLSSLGSSDVEGERHLLMTVSERLSEHSTAARTELAQKGKMLFSCSVLAGLAIVIFII